ncbi:RNA polymerase sigma factor [Alicyclobacillus sp. ALC3]|uniref:RNA polymerase sigma factor n=1 Tax=Alicyclobacillus sp. ALC3 TaxID=2796143 RepID=UPI0023789F9D|nr:RNA polymerase sigma factor [Alicyclobacillus sp. ALC3]WDL98782.1 RNA polymerase sigma factor [Alicyclobacillus sp. ALC3]
MEEQSVSDVALMLFEQHGDEIYRYVLYTVTDESDTEDIVQDIFLRVLQSWKRFNHKSSPKTWLWSIANNCVREYFRKKRRQQAIIPLIDDFADESVSDVLDELNLQDSLRQLNVIQRQVFVERVIHKRSTSETAVLLNWSQAKVRTTLHRAIVKLREVLARGDDVHA